MPFFQRDAFLWRNPVLLREMRARWRHPMAFVLVAAYATILVAGVAMQLFAAEYQGEADFSTQLSRSIFETLTWTQLLGWLVLGPALTAGSIAAEREAGLHDGLLLTQLHPREIAWGKWLSAMSLVVLLLLVPLPAIAVCFMLGGVSPMEFVGTFALHAGTAASGTAIGLNSSAWSRRAGGALGSALFAAFLWQIGFLLLQSATSLGLYWQSLVSFGQIYISPIWGMVGTVQGTSDISVLGWLGFLFFHSVFTFVMLRAAARGAGFPLELENRPVYHAPVAPPPVREIAPESAPDVKPNRRARPSWPHFENPVLQREARARLRFAIGRSGTTNDVALGCSSLFYFIYILPLTLMAWFSIGSREVVWWAIGYPWMFAMTAMAALPAASALSSEREAGHWEALWLSPLSAHDIIGGKLWGVLFGCAYWSLYLLPGMVPCLFGGITLDTAFSTLVLVGCEVWLCANVGLFWSALFRKSSTATNWTIISLVVLLCFMPGYLMWHSPLPYALFAALPPLIGGELLLLGTHRILRDAPREK